MRFVRTQFIASALLAVLFLISSRAAFAIDDRVVDATALSELVNKAQNAAARDQCFLYAEIVHQMTELAGRQLNAGNDARETLSAVHEYAQKIHMGVAVDTKKLRNAQILMEHTAFRLNEILHSASMEDRPILEATMKQLNSVQNELMMQVFKH